MNDERLTFNEIVWNPDVALERARATGEVVEADEQRIAVRYEAVRAMLREPRMRPSYAGVLERIGISSGALHDWLGRSPLDLDGEPHRCWRQLMARAFTPATVEGLRPFLRAEAARLCGAFADRGSAEFVEEFAQKFPALALCELIGIPVQDRARFSAWAELVGIGFNVVLIPSRIAEVNAAMEQLLAYTKSLVTTRRAYPGDDLLSRLALAAKADGVDPELVHESVASLVFAGHETTKNQLGWLIVVLSDLPDEWDSVARQPVRAKRVVEEVLRLRSSVTSVPRLATEDVELFGTRISAGQVAFASLWSANRDDRSFANAASYDADAERSSSQVAFGSGVHHCLGAALARAELQEALIALTAHISCPALAPGAAFLPPLGMTGPTALPITFTSRLARAR